MKLLLPFVALAMVAGSMMIGAVEGDMELLPPTQLKRQFYKKTNTCANAEAFIRYQVQIHYQNDKTIAPKLLRLVYSDCMVSGCDGSILLDGPDSEKTAKQNIGLGGFILIDKIKQVLEARCPGAVSCADILQLATRDAVYFAGGPSYIVLTGRRDGMSSKASSVDLPSPDITWEEGLKYFQSKGLDVLDYTTLLGAHSMGKARCRYLYNRLYNYQGSGKADPSMDSTLLAELMRECPKTIPKGQQEGLVFLNHDSGNEYGFTNKHYSNILEHKGVLEVDQQLFNGNDTHDIAEEFADPKSGLQDYKLYFALSMVRMGAYKVLTGKDGEIRKNCHFTNGNKH